MRRAIWITLGILAGAAAIAALFLSVMTIITHLGINHLFDREDTLLWTQ